MQAEASKKASAGDCRDWPACRVCHCGKQSDTATSGNTSTCRGLPPRRTARNDRRKAPESEGPLSCSKAPAYQISFRALYTICQSSSRVTLDLIGEWAHCGAGSSLNSTSPSRCRRFLRNRRAQVRQATSTGPLSKRGRRRRQSVPQRVRCVRPGGAGDWTKLRRGFTARDNRHVGRQRSRRASTAEAPRLIRKPTSPRIRIPSITRSI
jgi:hypothetical protein